MDRRRWLFPAGLIVLFSPLLLIVSAIQLENRDPFCASCHTQPESAFVARAERAPIDLASAHATGRPPVRCIDCHSGQGASGRSGSLYQGMLDLAAYVSGVYGQPAVTKNPVGDEGCLKCHSPVRSGAAIPDAPQIRSNSHYHRQTYISEWQIRRRNPKGTCAVCHASHWDGGQASTGYRNNLLINDACKDCHSSLAGWTPPGP